MKIENVALLGTAMTRFADHRDKTLVELATEAGLAALADAGSDLRDVGEAYVGSMLAPPMLGVRIMKQLGLTGLPVVTVEAASASGLVALREATFAVASGRYSIGSGCGVGCWWWDSSSRNSAAAVVRGSVHPGVGCPCPPAVCRRIWAGFVPWGGTDPAQIDGCDESRPDS